MNSGMIRATGGVKVPNSQQTMGMGAQMGGGFGAAQPGMGQAQQGMNPQQQMSQGDMLRQTLSNSLSGVSGSNGQGAFNWGNFGGGGYDDEGLRQIKASSGIDENSTAYLVERVSPAMFEYMRQLYYGAGQMFEAYKQARDSFPASGMGGRCPVRTAFVEDINRQPQFVKIVAVCGSPFFGKRLIEMLRQEGRDDIKATEYLDTVYVAVRNVLFFELVSWLMKTPRGQQYSRQLPADLMEKFANLGRFKEVANATFETFGQQNPYAALEFKRPDSTRADWSALYGQYSEMFSHHDFSMSAGGQQPIGNHGATDDIMQMVHRNAALYRGEYRPTQPQQTHNHGDTVVNWDNVRNDMHNLTPQNKAEFNLKRFFYPIGKDKHFFIPESDWKAIRHAFRKHAEQGPEETVQPGGFRIVIIDVEGDSGWFSRVLRSEKLDMHTVLSDPAKLLPLIDSPEDLTETYKVQPVAIEDVAGKASVTIPIATCKKLKDIPLIQVKEQITGNNSAELSASVDSTNATIVKNIQTENATAFHVVPWDVFKVQAPEEKIRLYNDMPFLFRDNGISDNSEGPTPYQAARALRTYFANGIISAELAGFIDGYLTTLVNNWLVNAHGYTVSKGNGTHLTIDSFVADMEDLSNYLKEHNEAAHQALHVNDQNTHLVAGLAIFNYDNPFAPELKDDEELSPINKLKKELDLVVQRPLYIAVVNGRGGPIHTTDEAIVMRRSQYPEYFQLVEKGFEDTMGDALPYDTTDKLLRFSENGNTWLFTYSAYDPNVATLRHIANTKPLVLLPMD